MHMGMDFARGGRRFCFLYNFWNWLDETIKLKEYLSNCFNNFWLAEYVSKTKENTLLFSGSL